MTPYNIYTPIKEAAEVTDEVIVAFSGGKDSVVTMDLCQRYFKKVHAVFMYLVPDLSFQEALLKYYEKKLNIEILRIPHFVLAGALGGGYFRMPDESVPKIDINDVYTHVREHFGCPWIAAGERTSDSIWRYAIIKKSGAVDHDRQRIYPVAHFKQEDIMRYLKVQRLPYALETQHLGYSMRGLAPRDSFIMFHYYPEDFTKIRKFFPFVDAAVENFRIQLNTNNFDQRTSKEFADELRALDAAYFKALEERFYPEVASEPGQ